MFTENRIYFYALFSLMFMTIPTIYFIFVIIEFTPPATHVLRFLDMLTHATKEFGGITMILALSMVAAHVYIYTAIFGQVSWAIIYRVMRLKTRLFRVCVVAVLTIPLIVLPFLPIYSAGNTVSGHGQSTSDNLCGIYDQMYMNVGCLGGFMVAGCISLLLCMLVAHKFEKRVPQDKW